MQADLGHPKPQKFESSSSRCAATSTSNGCMINLNPDSDEEWLTYEKLTEIVLLRSKAKSTDHRPAFLRNNQAKSADVIRHQSVKLTKNKSIVLKNAAQPVVFDKRADGDKATENVSPLPMRASLFPRVSPYVLFQSHDHIPKKLPKDFARLLKWKFTTSMPRVLIKILISSGYQVVNKGTDWSGVWNLSSKDTARYQRMKSFQKVRIKWEDLWRKRKIYVVRSKSINTYF